MVRFLAALLLIQLVVGAGLAIERRKLKLHRLVSTRLQDVRRAEEEQRRLMLRASQLSAATRLLQRVQVEPAKTPPPKATVPKRPAPQRRRDRTLLRAGRR